MSNAIRQRRPDVISPIKKNTKSATQRRKRYKERVSKGAKGEGIGMEVCDRLRLNSIIALGTLIEAGTNLREAVLQSYTRAAVAHEFSLRASLLQVRCLELGFSVNDLGFRINGCYGARHF